MLQGLLSFQKLDSNRKYWIWGMTLVLGALLVSACMPVPPMDSPSGAKDNMPQENQADTSPAEKFPTPTSTERSGINPNTGKGAGLWKVVNKGRGIIPRVSTNIPNRVNRLKAIGNGQVPQVAATAWEMLKPC